MKLHFRLLSMAALLCGLFIVTAWADTPTNMNVQGRLTDGSGNPVAPGLKIFTFKIFNAATGGTEIWPGGPGEDQTLSTDDNGLWNAAIGKVIPLTPSVFSTDTARWLEVTVDDGVNPAETLTRIKLNTNPYAFRAHSSENADSLGGLPASAYGNSGWADDGSVVRLNNASDSVGIGTASPNYKLDVAGTVGGTLGFFTTANAVDGSGNALADVTAVSGYGRLQVRNTTYELANLWGYSYGELDLFDSGGSGTVELDANVTQGGLLQLRKEDGTTGMLIRGGSTTAGASLSMNNSAGTPTVAIDAGSTGDGSVVLPPGAISASEIADEPGISQGVLPGSIVSVPTGGTSMIDIVTTTLTIPAPGYIVVEAEGQANFSGTTSDNYFAYQIDETAGGGTSNYYQYVGETAPASTGNHYTSIAARRTYFKSAGTYTFRLEAKDGSGFGSKYIFNPVITAEYFPTSYGTVSTVATASEATQFESAKPIVVSASDPQAGAVTSGGTAYQVDLRELELKAAKLKAEAQAAEAKLLEARLANQESQGIASNASQTQER